MGGGGEGLERDAVITDVVVTDVVITEVVITDAVMTDVVITDVVRSEDWGGPAAAKNQPDCRRGCDLPRPQAVYQAEDDAVITDAVPVSHCPAGRHSG